MVEDCDNVLEKGKTIVLVFLSDSYICVGGRLIKTRLSKIS